MIFNILTATVFIAELIIACSIIRLLYILDNKILQANETIVELKPGIKDVGYLIKKISAQYVEFAYDFVLKIKQKRDDSIFSYLNKIIITLFIFKINSKFIKKIILSRGFRRLKKALLLLEYMV